MMRLLLLGLVLALVAAACSTRGGEDDTATDDPSASGSSGGQAPSGGDPTAEVADDSGTYPPAPEVPDGPFDATTTALLDRAFARPPALDTEAVTALGESGDPRVLWLISDMMRFVPSVADQEVLADAAEVLGGFTLEEGQFAWGPTTNILLAWDLPVPDSYVDYKERLFTAVEPGWQPFFDDEEATIDWRQVSWGGVFIDDRPLGDPNACPGGCIPALDDPPFWDIGRGAYYPDEGIVFGVEVGGEAVALPRNIMEVHEMVNATIGDRRVAIPYCTLCGAAQVYFTDVEGGGNGDIVMRTSGLLRRSNKVMYDLTTGSVLDTFTGEAVSGPLREAGLVLSQAPVVTTTWGDWKAAHPDTTILAGDGGIGRNYPLDPLRGRDDDGPIFPIGDVDSRLPVQEQVLGVALDNAFYAFPAEASLAALADGEDVSLGPVTLAADGGGLIALVDGGQVAANQAFWFAWSQFHPSTLLWPEDA